MTVSVDLDQLLNNLVSDLGSSVFFVIISSENGAVIKHYINEEEFNKASISLNVSQLYELAEEITESIGLPGPDFTIIHTGNYYVLSIKILENVIILLTEDQVDVSSVFSIINKGINPQ